MSDPTRHVATAATRLPAQLAGSAHDLLLAQDCVATTAQIQGWGASRSLVARRVAAGDWQQLFRGVVVLHSGPISWRQQARGALLYAGSGAALSHRSAAYVHGIVRTPGPAVIVSIPARRAVAPQRGLVVRRRRAMPFAAGRLRTVGVDETLLDLLGDAGTQDDAVGLVCDAVRSGAMPGRILLAAQDRRRIRHRELLLDLLGVADRGIESPLELRYERDVERVHRLPTARTQLREQVAGLWIRADRVYVGLGVRVELDGQLAHPHGRTDADTWRDNAVVIDRSDITLRYRWRHVVAKSCATAAQVAAALRSRGWQGHARRCSPTCPVIP